MPSYLFKPIHTLSRGLRSKKQQEDNDVVEARVSSSSQEENVPVNPTTRDNEDAATSTTTVSPPLDETVDTSAERNGEKAEQKSEGENDTLHEHDVLCTPYPDKAADARPGNTLFRNVVSEFRESYQDATCEEDRAEVATNVIATFQSRYQPPGRFVKLSRNGSYVEIQQRSVLQKVSRALARRQDGTSIQGKLPVTPSPRRKRRLASLKVKELLDQQEEEGNEAPAKRASRHVTLLEDSDSDGDEVEILNPPTKKKRGRPRKSNGIKENEVVPPKKKLGRPRKSETLEVPIKKKRGRPRKSESLAKKEPNIISKLPRRNANKTQQEANVYFSADDESDDEDSYLKPAARRSAARSSNTKRAPRRARKRVESDSSDDAEDSDDQSSRDEKTIRSGPWSKKEKLSFLIGLKVCGRSWTDVADRFVPTRSNKQVKWYGGRLIEEAQSKGVDIFSPLKSNRNLVRRILSKRNEDDLLDSDVFCFSDDDDEAVDDMDEVEDVNLPTNIPWSEEENLLLLYGLKCLGRSKWQQLHDEFLPTRSRHSIRGRAQKYMKDEDKGIDIYEPLEGKEEFLDDLISSMPRRQLNNAVHAARPNKERAPARSPSPEPVDIPRVYINPKPYNATIIESMVSAKVSAGHREAAFKLCRDTLTSWYDDAEETLQRNVRCASFDNSNMILLRNEIAKLWCIYARLIGTISRQLENVRESDWTKLAVEVLDVARSCPLVGNHHEIIQGRLFLEFEKCSFLKSMDSDTLKGFSVAVENVDVDEGRIRKILSTSIAVCNDAVRQLPYDRSFSLDAQLYNSLETEKSTQTDDTASQQQYLISNMTAELAHRVELLRSSWRPSLHAIDGESTFNICNQANRLSRIKEALFVDEDNPLGTEYGCGCCWSIFSTERELIKHKRSCRGGSNEIGGHEQFQQTGVSDYNPAQSPTVGAGSKRKRGMNSGKTEEIAATGLRRPSVRPFCEVEYGCSHHGCSCVFSTKKELVDHQRSCGNLNGTVCPDQQQLMPSPMTEYAMRQADGTFEAM